MKKLLFLFILMLSPMLASAQTVSDVQNSGCLNKTRGEEPQRVPTIVLTKEGNILSVQLLNYEENCCTEDFSVTSNISGDSEGEPCSVSISVQPSVEYECDCTCPFNVSFTVRNMESNNFYLDCWWYKGQVELTESEPLVLEYNNSNTPKFFPTGMTWEEIVVNPNMELKDNNAFVYEIATDTIIGGITYKKVLKNNEFSGLCVRENDDKVWLLTKEYPTEILLYNFDWDSNQEIVTEYLKGQDEEDDDYKVCQETTPVGDSQSVEIEGNTYQYIMKRLSGTVIRGIGKVAELNRYPCLLSYREPSIILPGLEYLKVHWIKRNGVEIFRSESAKEWTEEIRDNYRPMIEDGKVWTYQYYNDMTGKSYNVTRVVDGDIIIGGLAYKKICDNVGGQYLYALREEGKKVYIVYPHYETASLLYDFSKNAGDVINELAYPLIVASVDTIDIDGVKFRRMRVQDADKPVKEWNGDLIYLYNFWIEGVGSESLLETSIREPGNNYNLLSCKINGRVYTQQELLGIASKPTPQNDYRPFVEEDKVWKVGSIPTDLGIPVQIVDYYYFDGDTIIDGKTCKQMMCQHFTSPNYPYYDNLSQPNYLRYVGAWYEENQKVYFYDERKQSMVLKYDFSLGDYETLDFLNVDGYPPFIIGPKQTGGIEGFKGVYRDIMMENIRNTTWLEGIGGLDAPFRDAYDPRADRMPEFLMACKAGDEVIYFNDRYEDGATPAGARKNRFDFSHTTKIQPKTRISRGEEQSLYGEYNDQQLDINLDPLDEAYHVSITNESGQAIYEKNINAGNIVGLNIDISAYAKGRYTVTIENSSESFTGEFEAQTTGINAITINKEERSNHIYNLQGQRISTLQKGLNIVNGQKIFVK